MFLLIFHSNQSCTIISLFQIPISTNTKPQLKKAIHRREHQKKAQKKPVMMASTSTAFGCLSMTKRRPNKGSMLPVAAQFFLIMLKYKRFGKICLKRYWLTAFAQQNLIQATERIYLHMSFLHTQPVFVKQIQSSSAFLDKSGRLCCRMPFTVLLANGSLA